MTPDQELLAELKKINRRLDLYVNPFKNAGYSFLTGIFHSLGSLFGTVIIAGALYYFISQLNITKSLTSWTEQFLTQISWDKIVPRPVIEINSPATPSAQPLPDQF